MSELDEMLEAIDPEEWLSYEGIDYKLTRGTRGDQLNVKTCPSCGKDDWKVYLNAETGLGNCFSGSCPKGTFNKFSFMREYLLNYNDKVNMREYIKGFAREMGWRPRRKTSVGVEMTSKELVLPDYKAIPVEGRNLKYLINRRVSVEVAEYFNLGYIKSGYFGKRIFIPIHDLGGELVSFQARDITGLAEKKYLFPSGFSSTGRILYNGQNALKRKQAVLVEGAFDAIGVKVSFDEDKDLRDVAILGSFGMNLSGNTTNGDNDQLSRFIKLKESGLETVTIMWDGEAKAILKAVLAGQTLMKIGLKVRIAILPLGRDPSDVDPELLRHCYYRAEPLTSSYALKVKMKRGVMYL